MLRRVASSLPPLILATLAAISAVSTVTKRVRMRITSRCVFPYPRLIL
jgi:hypothetical protein